MNRPDLGMENLDQVVESLQEASEQFSETPGFTGKLKLILDVMGKLVEEGEKIEEEWKKGEEGEEGEEEEEATGTAG